MAQDKVNSNSALLDPVSRSSEILFGLIMVLSFTGTLSAVSSEDSEVREVLIGALGCNLVWGIIDAFFYLMNCLASKGRENLLLKKLKDCTDNASVRELFSPVIPEIIRGCLSQNTLTELKNHLLSKANDKPARLLTFEDYKAALIVFALVFLSTFPIAIPFLIMNDLRPAMRISNMIALILLFSVGYSLGCYAGLRAWVCGISMTVIGTILVAITIALGG